MHELQEIIKISSKLCYLVKAQLCHNAQLRRMMIFGIFEFAHCLLRKIIQLLLLLNNPDMVENPSRSLGWNGLHTMWYLCSSLVNFSLD